MMIIRSNNILKFLEEKSFLDKLNELNKMGIKKRDKNRVGINMTRVGRRKREL